ncbi:type II toxin-antitoxin system HicA family toxin [Rhizobium sp. CC-YZS058]|uniref:type II toxin-antitoxin system HicA family toxin n=1 Tax=Rhizobium sp. CC-YZS058 TaxID=3042153 RepID=UPI002B05887D|nr:type II toxin-antitoxin system HicA family toxin [Rhizobium sp. CC-YZS058]MEA3535028.1 type II toxin-antitoxin system HicA family toxin [Rhizobium sp. CC-YZS058]
MTRSERLLDEFRACTGGFSYRSLLTLLRGLGYDELSTGGGSRRKFVHSVTNHIIRLHEPHPDKDVKAYVVRQIRDSLQEQGFL